MLTWVVGIKVLRLYEGFFFLFFLLMTMVVVSWRISLGVSTQLLVVLQ
jgi:hypothetical protein